MVTANLMAGSEVTRRIETTYRRETLPIRDFLDRDDVFEVSVNPDGAVWVDAAGMGYFDTGRTLAPESVRDLVFTLADYAGETVTMGGAEQPFLACRTPEGHRFQAELPPIAEFPFFSIRCHRSRPFSLDEFLGPDDDPQIIAHLRRAIDLRRNLLVVGQTGSGKTSFASALCAEMASRTPEDRVVVVEDTAELRVVSPNRFSLRTARGRSVEGKTVGGITMSELLRHCLRLNPARILVGELRGREALDLIKAWNTGHEGGITTVHANSALDGISRLEMLMQEAEEMRGAADLARRNILRSVHEIVFLKRSDSVQGSVRRSVRKIAEYLSVHRRGEEYELHDQIGREVFQTI
ncbi:MAG: ATPase, T2SS/T4P/T4SS family [Leptospirales bacterium]